MSTRSFRMMSPVRSRRLSPLRSRIEESRLGSLRTRSPVRVASPTRRASLRRSSPVRRGRPSAATRRVSPRRKTTRRASPRRKTTRRASPRRKTARRASPRRKPNPWVEFIKAHEGQGLTFKQLSKMYKKL